MRLLLDQGLPRSAALLLREAGLDVVHTGEVGYATAEDTLIIEWARANGRVIVTLDADFHAHLALSGASTPSVIRIRIEGLRAADVTQLVLAVLADWQEELEGGAVLTVQIGRIRFRRLPFATGNE